jgi:glutamate-1-semialdehyde 2,1-aminomutase/spore coat polysaccharide biosynthesis protein SpsF
MKKVVIIQARMGASRFPGKVLELLKGKELLWWVVERSLAIPAIDQVVVATSVSPSDDRIHDFCIMNKIECFRGSEMDVLSRFYKAADQYNADIIIRITADCPLLDPHIAGQVLRLVSSRSADYASNVLPPTWPDGLDCEAFTMTALENAHKNAMRNSDREHVTPYIRNNQHLFRVRNVSSSVPGLQTHRWTVDTPEDLAYLEQILSQSKGGLTTWDIIDTIELHSEIKRPPSERNEGFSKSLKEETTHCVNFKNSQALLKQAFNTIPLGAQTFSKSYIQFPENTSPMFLTHGLGARVWDVDGNEYIDLISGLMPVVLGYNDPDVNHAIQNQLTKGISFSLSTELEIQLAEKLCSIIPSAEKVRFAKNGTDVTSAAIRLARAYTGRDKVIVCGYHGWQDWYIGSTTRNKGIPKAVCDLTTSVPYNDLDIVEDLISTEAYASIIMEPCNSQEPLPGYLQGIKDVCEKYGAILIFDEIVTGFRFSLGGAQRYFGVTPHLSCFGKAMGNGMPISAIVGQNHVMKEMEEIFFSGTFGGETLSLAASLATIEKIENENVINHLWSYGADMGAKIDQIILEKGVSGIVKLSGYAPWKIIQFFDHPSSTSFEIKTFFIQEMVRRGVLINSSLNISFSHGELEKHKLLKAFEEVLALVGCYLDKGINQHLHSPSIRPLFKVR